MKKIDQVIIVEGKYDLIKLSSIVDALIITTDGFGIFKDKEKRELIKTLGQKNGVIILTDSDAAGFKIRTFLSSILPKECVKHAYIPNVIGKEKRKETPSKEGLLGVEGVDEAMILSALELAAVESKVNNPADRKITKFDLYEFGFCGQQNSSQARRNFLKFLNLPQRLNSNSMLSVLNSLMTYDEFVELIKKM